jgi:hypothetical protein
LEQSVKVALYLVRVSRGSRYRAQAGALVTIGAQPLQNGAVIEAAVGH